jgi:hypothetical protein
LIVQYIDRIDDRVFVWSAVTLAALVPSGIGNEHAHALSHTHTCVTQHIDRIDDREFVWSGITLAAPIIRFKKRPAESFAFAREAKGIIPLDVEAVDLISLQELLFEVRMTSARASAPTHGAFIGRSSSRAAGADYPPSSWARVRRATRFGRFPESIDV